MAKKVARAVILLDQAGGALREDDGEVRGLDLHPAVASVIERCRMEILIGVPGWADAGLAAQVDFDRLVEGSRVVPLPGLEYLSADSLTGLSALAADEPSTALVTADRRMRGEARVAGLQPAPHAALLPLMAEGHEIHAARISGPRDALQRLVAPGGVVPMQFQPAPEHLSSWALIALCTDTALTRAVLARLTVVRLDYDAQLDDLVWARIDEASKEAQEALSGRSILYAEPGQMLLSLAPHENAQAFHLHGGHGHAELLTPDPELMRTPVRAEERFATDALSMMIDDPECLLEPVPRGPRDAPMRRWVLPRRAEVTACYEADLARYTGVTPLDARGTIASRHTAHPDNKRAEAALLADLDGMGYCAYRHDFTHAGQTHSNIIADLPGSGRLQIRADVVARYQEILRRQVTERSRLAIADGLEPILGAALSSEIANLPDPILRRRVEEILMLRPWYPWWRKRCRVPGIDAELVIVGAHLDSTAGFDPDYSAPHDPAPGTDDNGSGTAAVLSLARYFTTWRGKLTHTIRFCFFNAEESGLVGSKAYASSLKASDAPVRAVYCADMIGFDSDSSRVFELHAGYPDPAVRDLSVPLADEVAAAAAAYGTLAPAQIYRGTGHGGAPDRDVYDGAINRSDHAAFHQQGWGAVLGSEDFFANLGTEPDADPNPNYHRRSDTAVNIAYARDITCAFAKAIKDKAL